ncbi:MAG TPA: hypothetical protein GX505_14330 [Clostridiales bacterium]|nr:hypothetical protein [Clostridiales bacterium]
MDISIVNEYPDIESFNSQDTDTIFAGIEEFDNDTFDLEIPDDFLIEFAEGFDQVFEGDEYFEY